MAEGAVLGPPTIQRGPALRPIMAQVREVLRRQASGGGTVKFAIKQHVLEVGPWEIAQLQDILNGMPLEEGSFQHRLFEAIAVQAKGLNDLGRMRSDQPLSEEQIHHFREELVGDLALAQAIYLELEKMVEGMNEAGKAGMAKNQAAFNQKMAQTLALLKEPLDQAELGLASAAASRLESEALNFSVTQAQPLSDSDTTSQRTTGVQRQDLPEKKKGLGKKHMVIACTLTVALVVGAFYLIPAFTQKYDISQGLRFVQGVEKYTGTPPNIVVTVQTDFWNGINSGRKDGLILAVAAAVEREGYTRAEFVLPSGKAVAQWNKDQGIKRLP